MAFLLGSVGPWTAGLWLWLAPLIANLKDLLGEAGDAARRVPAARVGLCLGLGTVVYLVNVLDSVREVRRRCRNPSVPDSPPQHPAVPVE